MDNKCFFNVVITCAFRFSSLRVLYIDHNISSEMRENKKGYEKKKQLLGAFMSAPFHIFASQFVSNVFTGRYTMRDLNLIYDNPSLCKIRIVKSTIKV